MVYGLFLESPNLIYHVLILLLFQFHPICSQAFPSLGGGGKRLQNPTPRPLKRQKVVFIQPKKSWTHDFCLLHKTHQTTTPKLKLLSTLKEAGLGKKGLNHKTVYFN